MVSTTRILAARDNSKPFLDLLDLTEAGVPSADASAFQDGILFRDDPAAVEEAGVTTLGVLLAEAVAPFFGVALAEADLPFAPAVVVAATIVVKLELLEDAALAVFLELVAFTTIRFVTLPLPDFVPREAT